MKKANASRANTAVTAMLDFVQYPSSGFGVAVGSAMRLLLSSAGTGAMAAMNVKDEFVCCFDRGGCEPRSSTEDFKARRSGFGDETGTVRSDA
jgi:hypothetical protein